MTAALGLSMSCYYFFCCMLILINGDCAGVVCTMHIAKSQFFEARVSFMRGQAVTTMLLIFTICGFYPRLDIILQAVGFPKEVSDLTW
jgi:hypothetical protein